MQQVTTPHKVMITGKKMLGLLFDSIKLEGTCRSKVSECSGQGRGSQDFTRGFTNLKDHVGDEEHNQ